MAVLAPPDWLIEGVLTHGSTALLVGESGIGKTFVALDMAFAVAAGVPWHGRKTIQAPVVYILAEGTGSLPNRVRAWRADRGIVPGVPVGVWFWNSDVQLANFPDRNQFVVALGAVKPAPRFIIVDTLARCFNGKDENSASEMGEFVQGLDTLRHSGATVLVLHHEGHTKGRERGSTALRGAVDTVMYLHRDTVAKSLLLTTQKQRDGAPMNPMGLVLRKIKLPDGNSSCVVEDAPPVAPLVMLPAHWTAAVVLLGRQWPKGTSPETWRAALKMSKRAFQKMRFQVVKHGFVVDDGETCRRKTAEDASL